MIVFFFPVIKIFCGLVVRVIPLFIVLTESTTKYFSNSLSLKIVFVYLKDKEVEGKEEENAQNPVTA